MSVEYKVVPIGEVGSDWVPGEQARVVAEGAPLPTALEQCLTHYAEQGWAFVTLAVLAEDKALCVFWRYAPGHELWRAMKTMDFSATSEE